MTDRDGDKFEVFVDPTANSGERFADASAGGAFEVPTDTPLPIEGFTDPVGPIPADRFSDPTASVPDEQMPLFMRTDRSVPPTPSPVSPVSREPIVKKPVELPLPAALPEPVQPTQSEALADPDENGYRFEGPPLPYKSSEVKEPVTWRDLFNVLRITTKNEATDVANAIGGKVPFLRRPMAVLGSVLLVGAAAAATIGVITSLRNGDVSALPGGGSGSTDPSQIPTTNGPSTSSAAPEVAPPASSSSQPPETTTTTTTTESITTTTNPTTTTTEATTTTTQSPSTTSSPSSPNASSTMPTEPTDPGNPGTGPDTNPADPNANGQPTVNSRTVQPGDNIYKIGAREEGLDGSQVTEGLRDGSIKAYDHNGNLVADPGKIQPGYTVEFTTPATTPPLPEVAPADAVVLGDGGTLSDSTPHLLESAGKPVTSENIHNATEAIMMYNQETYGIDLTWESAHNIHGTTLADGTSVATLRGQVIHMPPIGMLDELMARAEELSPTN